MIIKSVIAAAMAMLLILSEAQSGKSLCDANLRNAANRYMERGRLRSADSIYADADGKCILDAFDLMRWMKIKAIMSDYPAAGILACRIEKTGSQFSLFMRNQISEMLKDAGKDTAREVISEYFDCVKPLYPQDEKSLRLWAAEIYARFGLFDEEVAVINLTESAAAEYADYLMASAEKKFGNRLFNHSIKAALYAYPHLDGSNKKSGCAIMLYQAYNNTGRKDSAALWLQMAADSGENFKGEAATFFQKTGYLTKSDSIINKMHESFMRDTLVIRQKLYSGNTRAAADLCRKYATGKNDMNTLNQLRIWEMLSLLFAGKYAEARTLTDSIRLIPKMSGLEKLLNARYILGILKYDPAACVMYGTIAYAAWLGKPEEIAAAIDSKEIKGISSDSRNVIITEAVRTLVNEKMFKTAVNAIKECNTSAISPELLFYYGESLLFTGDIDAGMTELEKLILEFPDDIFSEKSRILIQGKELKKSVREP
jgi:hypothetical protein